MREFRTGDTNQPFDLQRLFESLLAGKTNTVAEVTLTASSTSTVVGDELVSPQSIVILSPSTASAAAVSPFVSSYGTETFTITHTSSIAVDMTVRYAVIG